MCLLAQINPLKHPHHDDDETRTVQLHHAHQVCGIVAHTKDQGVSSVAIRSVAVVGCVLTDPRQQDEVLVILNRIYSSTGWNLKKVVGELRRAWGWDPPDAPGTGASLPVSASGLPPPPINPAAQGETLGGVVVPGAVMHHQHLIGGQRDTTIQQIQDARRHSQSQPQQHPPPPLHPPPPPLLLPQVSSSSFSTTDQRHRQPSLASNNINNNNAGGGATAPTLTSLSGFGSTTITGGGGGSGRPNSTEGSSSNHPSPSGTTTVHTPGSVSSTAANAATPPSNRPMVNPLLAQADFNQPNHPYREWYKPPEKGGHNWFGSSGGGLWPY